MKQIRTLLFRFLVCAILAAGLCPAALAAEPDREGWTAVSSKEELAAISNNLSGKYYLTANIDLTGETWTPIGMYFYKPFTGEFDGNGYVIKGLSVQNSTNGSSAARVGVGLFGCTSGAKLQNVSVIDANVVNNAVSDVSTGIFVGYGHATTIINCYTSGSVSSKCVYGTGGIVGQTMPRTGTSSGSAYILRCASSATVSSTSSNAGGIAGGSNEDIEKCYFTGTVTSGSSCAGGIVGFITGAIMRYCWASGSVEGKQNGTNNGVAGLVGSGSAFCAYTIANVNGTNGPNTTFSISHYVYHSAQPAVGSGSARDVYFEKGHFSVKGTSNTSWDDYTGSYLNGAGKSQTEMLTPDTYTGWENTDNPRTGETVWLLEEGKYPQLRHTGPIPTDFPAETETHTVSFASGALDGDAVTGLPESYEAEDGQHITLPAAPVRTNDQNWVYDFQGWSDGTSTYAAGADYEVTDDVTFTATWRLHSVNGDGEWSYLDAMIIMDHLAGSLTLTNEQLAVADRNGDGLVSYLDAMYIMDVLAGTITEESE